MKNKCHWCEKESEIRCISCKIKACEECLDKHLEVKLVSKEHWPEMREKIPYEN